MLLFNRQMRSKLPALEVVADDDIEVRDADATAKFRMAECAVSRRQAPIRRGPQPGDQVLLKKPSTADKLDSPFHPTPHTVVSTTGDQVVAESPEGVRRCRNVQFTKPLLESSPGSEEDEPSPVELEATATEETPPTSRPASYNLRPRSGLQVPARFR